MNGRPLIARLTRCIDGKAGARLNGASTDIADLITRRGTIYLLGREGAPRDRPAPVPPARPPERTPAMTRFDPTFWSAHGMALAAAADWAPQLGWSRHPDPDDED